MIWDKDTVEYLKYLIEEGWTHKQISIELDRTANAVRNKCYDLKLKSKNKRNKTHEQYVKELHIICPNLEVIGIYIDAHTPIDHKCRVCNKIHKSKPNNKLSGWNCKNCAGTFLKSHIQYVNELVEKCPTMIALEAYKGDKIKILHECTLCASKYKCSPHDRLAGHACKFCNSEHGINSNNFGIIYLVYYYEIDLYKYGITGQSTIKRNDTQGYKYEIIFERHFEKGIDAMNLEDKWSKNVQHLKVNTRLLKSGNTETFRYE